MTPNGRRPARLYLTIAALAVGLGVAGFFDIGTAYPHDPQHAEADWDMAKGGYRGSLKHPHRPNEPAKWFDVPYSAVIDKPNISGIAMVWWAPSYDMDGSTTPMWRYFIAGAGG